MKIGTKAIWFRYCSSKTMNKPAEKIPVEVVSIGKTMVRVKLPDGKFKNVYPYNLEPSK